MIIGAMDFYYTLTTQMSVKFMAKDWCCHSTLLAVISTAYLIVPPAVEPRRLAGFILSFSWFQVSGHTVYVALKSFKHEPGRVIVTCLSVTVWAESS